MEERKRNRTLTHLELLNLNQVCAAERKLLEPMSNRQRAVWASEQLKMEISEGTTKTVADHLGLPENNKRRTSNGDVVDRAARAAIAELADYVSAALATVDQHLTDMEIANNRVTLRNNLNTLARYIEEGI